MAVVSSLLSFLCCLLVITIFISQASAQAIPISMQICNRGNYTTNSIYHTNLNTLLSNLTSNTETNNYGFYNLSYGQNTNKVHAIGLCRGDINAYECRSCLNYATVNLTQLCPNRKEAIAWYDDEKCMLRFSDRLIFGLMEIEPRYYAWNLKHAKNVDQFSRNVKKLMVSLTSRAASGDSGRKYAAATALGPDDQTIYGLVQCTPDLSRSECSACLNQSIAFIPSCCEDRIGGRLVSPSCNMRFENYLFYETVNTSSPPPPSTDAPPSPLSPPPSTDAPPSPQPSQNSQGKGNRSHAVIAKVVPVVAFVTMVILICIYLRVRKPTKHFEIPNQEEAEVDNEVRHGESTQFDFDTIRVATNNFSYANKLGQGGFGPVYKGRLSNEQEIAVKRLSENSGQGDTQFKNEVVLMTRLQHRNLVRLLGFCIEGKERLLVYEFLANKSLDYYLFDPIKRADLDWKTRYKIIEGIARGLLYLHEDSQHMVIHLDLKPSNILLDADMKPKIADFGLSRLFVVDQTQAYASKIAGTLGYMAPEYAMHGKFSVKSDVFSFGVMILEIVSGQKNSGFRNGENVEHLLSLAWKSLRKGTASNIIDPTINECSRNEIVRCIHIGLLCVQERVADRPTLASVVLMLNNHSFYLPLPMKPAFFFSGGCLTDIQFSDSSSEATGSSEQKCNSVNEASISSLYPR